MFFGASPTLFHFAKQLRGKETEAEKLLWQRLSNKQLNGLSFRRQHPIVYFIADFYCHKAKLIIELDGKIHLNPAQFLYDQRRDNELHKFGLRVIRFENEKVLNSVELVLGEIVDFVRTNPL
jgi:cyclase